MKMDYVHVTPMQRAILEIYEPHFRPDNKIDTMIKTVYPDIPERIYHRDMTDTDYYEFGIFLMGIVTAMLLTDNDNVTREYRRECRTIRKDFTRCVELIMKETDID